MIYWLNNGGFADDLIRLVSVIFRFQTRKSERNVVYGQYDASSNEE